MYDAKHGVPCSKTGAKENHLSNIILSRLYFVLVMSTQAEL